MADFVNRVHVSPGIYASEQVDMKTAANSIGITKLAAVGETLKGPAFQPYWIHSPKEFSSVFGGTSTKKFPGSNYPQYELPYIANEYLKKGTELCVVRTLGVSGYNAGPAWAITGKKSSDSGATEYVIAILRSRGGYKYRPEFISTTGEDGCPCKTGNDSIIYDVGERATVVSCGAPLTYNMGAVSLSPYTSLYSDGTECTSYSLGGTVGGFSASYGDYGRFTINCIVGPSDKDVDTITSGDTEYVMHIPVSLNKSDKDYILNVLGQTNNDGDMPLYVESLYDVAWSDLVINQGYNEISQSLTKYNVGYVADYGGLLPVNGILTTHPQELKKKDVGKRFLYSQANGSPSSVDYYVFDYKKGIPEIKDNPAPGESGINLYKTDTCVDGHIYTVVQITDDGGKKYYVYRAYSQESTSHLNGDEKITARDMLLTATDTDESESKHGMIVYNEEDGLYYREVREFGGITEETTITKEVPTVGYNMVGSGEITEDSQYVINPSDLLSPEKTPGYTKGGETSTSEVYISFGDNFNVYEINFESPRYRSQQMSSNGQCVRDDSLDMFCVRIPIGATAQEPVALQFMGSQKKIKIYTNFSSGEFGEEVEINTQDMPRGYKYNSDGENTIFSATTEYIYIPSLVKSGTSYDEPTCQPKFNISIFTIDTEEIVGYQYTIVNKEVDNGLYKLSTDKLYEIEDKTTASHFGETEINVYTNYIVDVTPITCDLNNYKSGYRYSSTPWVVSNAKGDAKHIELNKLFRFHTISDGDCSVTDVKVSIENIRPDSGEFDVVVRGYDDSDSSSVVLESFRKCTMGTDKKSIAYKIGTMDGQYESKSKYITVEVIQTTSTKNSVPAGFLGYPVPNYDGAEIVSGGKKNVKIAPISYNKIYNENIQKRKQYFGVSELAGYDYDFFSFKGNMATIEDPLFVTNGFHLDCRLNEKSYGNSAEVPTITVDGVSGYVFDTVSVNERTSTLQNTPIIASENDMAGSIYEDVKLRKFTMVFAGGFDGWDVYRESRTNTDDFSYSNYGGNINTKTGQGRGFDIFTDASSYGIDGRAITSDYYATLAGISMLKNPEEVDINLLATPGIDTLNNTKLVEEVFNMLEDRADTFYIVSTPDKEAGASDYVDDIADVDEIVDDVVDKEIYSDYAATYYPWIKIEDNGEYVWLPATRDVVRNLAESDNTNTTMNLAPAGTTRGRVNAIRARKNLKNGESDALYEANINPVRTYAQEGLVIMGQKTLRKEDDLMNRVDVRRMVMRMRKLIAIGCLGLIFEPNDNNTVKAFKSIINGIMQIFVDNRAIEKWTMDVDDSQEARDRLELGAVIYIKPIRALEYITLNFVVTNNDVYFED